MRRRHLWAGNKSAHFSSKSRFFLAYWLYISTVITFLSIRASYKCLLGISPSGRNLRKPRGPHSDFVFIFHFSIFVFNFFFIFTSPFSFSIYISVFIFYFSVFVSNLFIFTDVFLSVLFNRQSRPSCFAGGSICRTKVSLRRSAALLTMLGLAQEKFLISPLLIMIALNHKPYFFSTYLFKLWKSH